MTERIEKAADVLFAQHAQQAAHAPLSGELTPVSISAAYDIQEALQQRYFDAGEQLAGWKVALTTPVMQALVGVDHPCAGGIFSSRVQQAPKTLDSRGYVRLGLEAEIAVELADALPPLDGGYTIDRVRPHIAALMPALEIVDDRGCDYPTMTAEQLIADNSFNFGCLLGPKVTDWHDIDLQEISTTVSIDKTEAGTGFGRDVLGHPLQALCWLANHLIARGSILEAGAIVMTGSLVKTQWPEPGQTMRHDMARLGSIEVAVV